MNNSYIKHYCTNSKRTTQKNIDHTYNTFRCILLFPKKRKVENTIFSKKKKIEEILSTHKKFWNRVHISLRFNIENKFVIQK